MRKQSTLTKEGIDLLEGEVKGFVGEDWWVGNQAEDWREHDPHQAALVMGGDPDMVLLDCGHHDCGAQFATALVAMHNRLPALIDMAKECLELREVMRALKRHQDAPSSGAERLVAWDQVQERAKKYWQEAIPW